METPTFAEASVGGRGERGIRTPGTLQFNGFQDRRIRPLCHLSGAKIGRHGKTAKFILLILNNIFDLIQFLLSLTLPC